MIIYDMTMKEFKRGLRRTKTLLLPYGTVEAHGDHLPLGTDTMIIAEVAKRAAEKRPLFVAPPIHYGVCTSTGDHPGTIGISPSTLRALTLDVVRDAYRKGLRNFILVSGHGGGLHRSAMKEAAVRLVEELEGAAMASLAIYDILAPEIYELTETENDSHAGEMETSAILHISPELVKGRSKEEYPRDRGPIIVRDKLKNWPGAVWGDPSRATVEKGARLIDLMVRKLVALIEEVEGARRGGRGRKR